MIGVCIYSKCLYKYANYLWISIIWNIFEITAAVYCHTPVISCSVNTSSLAQYIAHYSIWLKLPTHRTCPSYIPFPKIARQTAVGTHL
jgi:hypothetical protein